MKTLPLITLSVLAVALTGCTPSGQPSTGTSPSSADTAPPSLTIQPVTEVTPQPNGIVHTKTTLSITGAITDELVLDESEADSTAPIFQYISPALYKDTDITAAFFSYFAGGGYEIAFRQLPSGSIAVDKREISEGSGDEPGGCGPWTRLKEYPLTPATTITWLNIGTPTDQLVIECGGW